MEFTRSTGSEANSDLGYKDLKNLYEKARNMQDFEFALKYLGDLSRGAISRRQFREFLRRL